uniref:Protein tyrosine phosphatase receptor type N n=1 Tax=Scleropages formosus TaxID=113540 RepID=A0A8C9TYB9_SCLFO
MGLQRRVYGSLCEGICRQICLLKWTHRITMDFFFLHGLFGQCQAPGQERVQYQVSVPVLQRLQEVLKQLMLQGLSWQDDITQYIITKELSRVPQSRTPAERFCSHHVDSIPVAESPGVPETLTSSLVFLLQSLAALRKVFYQAGVSKPQVPTQCGPAESCHGATLPGLHDSRGPSPGFPPHPELMEASMTHKAEPAPRPAVPPASVPQQPPATSAPASLTTAVTVGVNMTAQRVTEEPGDAEPKETTSASPGVQPTVHAGPPVREEYGYIVTNQKYVRPLSLFDGVRLLETLAERIHLTTSTFINISVVGPALTFRIRQNGQNLSADDVAEKAVAEKSFLESATGLKILQTGVGEVGECWSSAVPGSRWVLLTLVGVACVGGILVAAFTIACLRHHARHLASGKLGLGPEAGADTHYDYQELCRQHMAAKSSFGRQDAGAAGGGVSSVSSQFSDAPQPSPSSHSSTPSWCEEPAQSNMDISTGHMILAYMEDHLKNKDRLLREWEALCSYQADPSSVSTAQNESNIKKNRNPEFVPYDHARVKLKSEINPSRTDYINASTIIEHDPRMPAYIATQGPLTHTIADFWQMVWESGCTVIVMMTALVEDGEKQCERYWPDEGSSLYHIYEVNLVSEHIWCNDFLVRSFYLKNVQTQETRTLTQFHFLSWPAQGIPTSTRPLLDFRRKVNKCYRGRSCPIIVHCSDGTGRTGTYILIDMVLNRMAKGVKEIDIAATLEHIRDQRPGMVRTKDQFEFALTAVAEEVNAILKALPQ